MEILALLNSRKFYTIIVITTLGIIIRLVYVFLIKPIFKKNIVFSSKQLKHLIKNAQSSREDLKLLLKFLLNQDNTLLKDFYHKLKDFDKKELSEKENSILEGLLKEINKLSK